jgi:leucine dehydrogenase
MDLFSKLAEFDHEQVIAVQNNATGLRGFLAIHDTTLGPACGGVRIWRYSHDGDALADALRLSRAMTYKASLAELPCGGGKTVILLNDDLRRGEAFEAFGQMVESLNGRYRCARDVGITDADLAAIARGTQYVAREPSPELGDISEHTAIGLWHGIRACLDAAGISGRARVAIQGVGSVGHLLAGILHREGMELMLADIDNARVSRLARKLNAKALSPAEILEADCDVLAPCALGGVVSRESAKKIRARIVCGSANNVLTGSDAADALADNGIIYGPDYLVNAGGLIRGVEYMLLGCADSSSSLARIYDRTTRVLQLAAARKMSPARIADELAESRLKRPKRFSDLTWKGTRRPAN